MTLRACWTSLPSRWLGGRDPFSLYMHYSPDFRVNFCIVILLCLLTDVFLLSERTQCFQNYAFFIFHNTFRPKHVVEDKRVHSVQSVVFILIIKSITGIGYIYSAAKLKKMMLQNTIPFSHYTKQIMWTPGQPSSYRNEQSPFLKLTVL